MKKDKIIYWISTGIISLMMLFSAYAYFTDPKIVDGFPKMGFPNWFRIELGIAKGIAALVLIVPQVPLRVKEWAYAGLGINLISAAILHFTMSDTKGAIFPMVLFVILVVSNIFLHKIKKA
ncbi:MAG: hypothetical protein K0R51_280 [Cytophagaceae bacterium]|jgi:hypothetical protein|nr:hypothetical protein [Cytophagaceae bacterium]